MTEIHYAIDPQESDQTQTLAIQLIEAKQPGARPLPPTLLYKLAPGERSLLEKLIQEELNFQRQLKGRAPQPETFSFALVHVPFSSALSLLKELSGTRRLYFQGKPLVADFFGQVEFYYRGYAEPSKPLRITGHLKWRETDIDLADCTWIGIGKPAWFIKGVILKTIATDINWKELKKLHQAKEFILEGHSQRAFLDTLDLEDPEAPKLVLEGNQQVVKKIPEPLPLLQLRDRLGAFADLSMDYEGQLVSFYSLQATVKNEKGQDLFKRNLEAERGWEKDLLETSFIRKNTGTAHYYCPVDQVAKSLSFLLELGWNVQDAKGQKIIKQTALQLQASQEEKAIAVKGKICFADYEADISDVLGSFNRRERFIQLASGTVGLLSQGEEGQILQELAQEGEVIGQAIKVRKSHLGALSSLWTTVQMDQSLKDLSQKLHNFQGLVFSPPSEDFQGRLRPYQQEGVDWLSFLQDYGFGGILADDMGLGKTVQVMAFLSRWKQDRPHLIVVPTSLLFNWKKEFEIFLPTHPLYLHHGSERFKKREELLKQKVILTSYTTLRLDLTLFQSLSFSSLILDEGQVIKNAHTQIAEAVCKVEASFRLVITGTPIENHMQELWSHFRFLMPDLLGSEESFLADVEAAQVDSRYLQKIKKKITPFILRRKKEQVAKDLPERIDQVVWIEMGEQQRALYEQFLAGVKGGLLKKVEVDGMQKHRLEILEAILRLRQICCHPLLVSSLVGEETQESAKLEMLMQDIETALDEGRKVLIYSQFTSMLKLMTKAAQQRGWSYAYLDGSTTNREKVVEDFQSNPATPLFFISLKAGGVGLNLTAADFVFLYDPWWNEAVEEQAINRAHRIGRKDSVIAKRFVTAESIEEKMMKLKASKRSIIDQVFDSDVGDLSLTIDDLRFLLS